jgi:hypothetical protein
MVLSFLDPWQGSVTLPFLFLPHPLKRPRPALRRLNFPVLFFCLQKARNPRVSFVFKRLRLSFQAILSGIFAKKQRGLKNSNFTATGFVGRGIPHWFEIIPLILGKAWSALPFLFLHFFRSS